MASMRFERQPHVDGGKNVIEFDSSPDRAISRAFGLKEGTVVLKEIAGSRTAERVDYDVFALGNGHSLDAKPTRRGILKHRTTYGMMRLMDGGHYGSKWA